MLFIVCDRAFAYKAVVPCSLNEGTIYKISQQPKWYTVYLQWNEKLYWQMDNIILQLHLNLA